MITFTINADAKRIREATRAQLNDALTSVALQWHEQAVNAAPVDTGRLRASLAWAAPNKARWHSANIDGETVSYQVPASDDLSIAVGTNVEYAAAVHDGLGAQRVTVKAHTRRISQAFGRRIAPQSVQVGSFERNVPARSARPFIAQPGQRIAAELPRLLARELDEMFGES
jgi:hypothetical protein